jgi:hypothetical protein
MISYGAPRSRGSAHILAESGERGICRDAATAAASKDYQAFDKPVTDATDAENRLESAAHTRAHERFEPVFNAAAHRHRPFRQPARIG